MTPAARIQTAIEILDLIESGQAAEQALTAWARRSRFAGAKDRAAIRDHVFDVLRCKMSYAALGGGETGRNLMIGACRAQGVPLDDAFSGGQYGPAPLSAEELAAGTDPETPAERFDIPTWLWPRFESSLNGDAQAVAQALQTRAPVQLRVNLAKTDRETAISHLDREGIVAEPHATVSTALNVLSGARQINGSTCFKEGLIELQDASSQAVVEALELQPGMRVLDYCAGGGGKSLALAAHSGVTVVAHDVAPQRMKDIPVRAKRAGVRIQTTDTDDLDRLGTFDVVLADAPCSGSGSWRRAPAGKWALTRDRLQELVDIQREVLATCTTFVSPDGVLAYATCSMLEDENTGQVTNFLRAHPDWSCDFARSWTPLDDGDGFFTAHLTR